jgi:hypothetical protein
MSGLPLRLKRFAGVSEAGSPRPKSRALFARDLRNRQCIGAGVTQVVESEPSGMDRSSEQGGSNSVVESQPSKLLVAGSIPVSRSMN